MVWRAQLRDVEGLWHMLAGVERVGFCRGLIGACLGIWKGAREGSKGQRRDSRLED